MIEFLHLPTCQYNRACRTHTAWVYTSFPSTIVEYLICNRAAYAALRTAYDMWYDIDISSLASSTHLAQFLCTIVQRYAATVTERAVLHTYSSDGNVLSSSGGSCSSSHAMIVRCCVREIADLVGLTTLDFDRVMRSRGASSNVVPSKCVCRTHTSRVMPSARPRSRRFSNWPWRSCNRDMSRDTLISRHLISSICKFSVDRPGDTSAATGAVDFSTALSRATNATSRTISSLHSRSIRPMFLLNSA